MKKVNLKKYNMVQSMSRQGSCLDNAPASSFFHTLKVEEVYGQTYDTRQEDKSSIFEYIEIFYNRKRRHSFLGLVSQWILSIDIIRKHTKMQHDFVSTKRKKDQLFSRGAG